MSNRVDLTRKILTIDSSDRSYGSGSSFDVNIDMSRFNAFNKASVLMCEVPKSYYHFDSAPTFSITESTGPVTEAVSITAGRFYTASQLAAELKTALDAASVSGGNSLTYTVTYSSTTGKFTIAVSAGETTFLTGSSELLSKYLGFEVSDTANVTSSSTYTGPNVANMQRYDAIYVNCSFVSNNNSPRLLTLLPSGTPDLSMISYNSQDIDLGSVNLVDNMTNAATFWVVDKNNKPIELNGQNMRLVLTLWNEN